MEAILLLVAGAAVVWFVKQTQPSAPTGTDLATTPGQALQPAPASSVTNSPLASIPIVGSIVSAIGTGAAVGAAVDKAVNPNSNSASQSGAKVLGSVALVTLSVAALLSAILPAFAPFILAAAAVILAVVAAIYTLWVFVDDIHALQYGQGGARKDYLKQYNGFVQSLQSSIAQQGSNPPMTQVQIDRVAIPFAEGYMARLNWTAYQALMATRQYNVQTDLSTLLPQSQGTAPNVFPAMPDINGGYLPGTTVQQTADSLWDERWGYDRGKFIGQDCNLVTTGARPWTDPPGWMTGSGVGGGRLSTEQTWILEHTPLSDLVSIDAGTLFSRLWGPGRASSMAAWYKANAIPLLPFQAAGVWIFVSYPVSSQPTLSDANTLAAINNAGPDGDVAGGLISAGAVYSVFNKSAVFTVGANPAIANDISIMQQNAFASGGPATTSFASRYAGAPASTPANSKYALAAKDAQTRFNVDSQSVSAPEAIPLAVNVKTRLAACVAATNGDAMYAAANALNGAYQAFNQVNTAQPPPNWQLQQVAQSVDEFNAHNLAIVNGTPFEINGQPIYKVFQAFYFQDKNNITYYGAGFVYANFILYRNAAQNASPAGNLASLQQSLLAKTFEGALNADGSLTYAGQTFHWNAPLS